MHGIERIRAGLACLLALAAFSSTASAADAAKDSSLFVKPERSVQGNLLSSNHDPAVQIGLPASATYVGVDRWILEAYAADIELHAFVQADKDGTVQKLYWVQFEGYLPSHPEYHHMYDSTRHVSIGGLDFLVDTWAGYNDLKDEPDSDTQHLKALLKAKGYAQPRSMIGVRFVHLMDGDRKELMFIYKEPAPSGLSADDLKQGGKAYGQWAGIEKGLVERGQQSFQLH